MDATNGMVESHPGQGVTVESLTGHSKESLLKCHICGRDDFKNPQAIGVHMGRSHNGESWIPKEVLTTLYIDKDMSTRKISALLDCGKKLILRHLRNHGIDVDKSKRESDHPPWHGFTSISDKVGHDYEIVITQQNQKSYTIPIHRLVAVAMGELDPSDWANKNIEVHHKTEHGLDNRPDKLEALTIKEHRQHHLGGSK